jgi:hypothetical protein
MELKLIKIETEYFITENSKVNPKDYGIGFAIGIKGYGRGFHLFSHDNSAKAKLNSATHGTTKVIYSTMELNNILPITNLKNWEQIKSKLESFGALEIINTSWEISIENEEIILPLF